MALGVNQDGEVRVIRIDCESILKLHRVPGVAWVRSSPELAKERGFEVRLAKGWTRARELPQWFEVGFRKSLPGGGEATVFIHTEVMPSPADLPGDTSAIRQHVESLVRQEFPDATRVNAAPVTVAGPTDRPPAPGAGLVERL